MKHTLGTAAIACGINKSTVLRAIKAGKISAIRNVQGEWQIDPAELHRVYPPVAAQKAPADAAPPYATALAMAEQRLADLKALLEDMRSQRDSWQRMAEAKFLAPPTKKSWWPWRHGLSESAKSA